MNGSCPRCKGSDVIKNGKSRQGRQRFLCVGCGKSFLVEYSGYHLSDGQKQKVVELYQSGMGVRSIGRQLGFSPTAVLNQVKRAREGGLELLHSTDGNGNGGNGAFADELKISEQKEDLPGQENNGNGKGKD